MCWSTEKIKIVMKSDQLMGHKHHLHCCLQREVMQSLRPFSWPQVLHKAIKNPERRFYFWWRLASYWYQTGGKFSRKRALKINRRLRARYGLDIKLEAKIGAGMEIAHYVGIVISSRSVIGENFHIKQNVTIGVKDREQTGRIYLGDNVSIGANSCVIGDDIRIGNNVHIGAMTFVNKDIPDNSIVYNKRSTTIVPMQEYLSKQ